MFLSFAGGPVLILVPGPVLALNGPVWSLQDSAANLCETPLLKLKL